MSRVRTSEWFELTSPDTNFGSKKNAQGYDLESLATLQTMLGRGGRSFSDRSPESSLQLAISFPELLVRVYQLVLALKAPNLGIIVCVDLAVRLFGIGYIMVMCTKTRRSRLCFRCCFAILSFTGLQYHIRTRFRDFGAPSFLGEVFTKGDTWGVPGLNSKTLIILQNSDWSIWILQE